MSYKKISFYYSLLFLTGFFQAPALSSPLSPYTSPVLVNQNAFSVHYGNDQGFNGYNVGLFVDVSDPQGLTDIAKVSVSGPGGFSAVLQDPENDGSYYAWISSAEIPPQNGTYVFRATDKEGNWIESTDIITRNMGFPANLHPLSNEFITTSTPTISWDAVTNAASYQLWINDKTGNRIWTIDNIIATSVIFNFDLSASSGLTDGSTYSINVTAVDAEGNRGEQNSRFVYSTNPSKPVLGNHKVTTYHGGDDKGSDEYGFDLWIEVADPQGMNDIVSVKLKTPDAIEYNLTDSNSDGRWETNSRGLTAPSPTGPCLFTVTDRSNNIVTITDNVTGWIQFAKNVKPSFNEVVTTANPVFSWDAVPGASSYQIYIWPSVVWPASQENWGAINVTSSNSVTYSNDGTRKDLVDGNLYTWDLRSFDSNGNYGYHYPTDFVYSTNTSAPVIKNPVVNSGHSTDGGTSNFSYNYYFAARVFDPQGMTDIASVTVTGPDNKPYNIKDDNGDGYYESWINTAHDIPPTGAYKFNVTDNSGKSAEASDNLTAVLDCPKDIVPAYNAVINTPNPVISWTAIPGASKYGLWISDSKGKQIWSRDLTTSSVVYNDDGLASENLTEGAAYTFFVTGSDADGNSGQQNNNRFTYSSNPSSPIINEPQIRSRNWLQDDLSQGWGIDSWVYVADPQGLNDVDSVWVEGPEYYHLRLYDDGNHNDGNANDGSFGNGIGLTVPPQLGAYTFNVVDKSSNMVTKQDQLTAVLDYPHNFTPGNNTRVSDPGFTMTWDGVEGAVNYQIYVNNLDWKTSYWTSQNLSQTTVQYNLDHTGSSLTDGGVYRVAVCARDIDNNESGVSGLKIAYRIGDRMSVYVDSSNVSGIENGTAQFPYNTLDEGIKGSVKNDTVHVANGTYDGSYDDIGPINLFGKDPVRTIIKGPITIRSAGAKVNGFKITGSNWVGIEVHENAVTEISNNIISGNAGGGIIQAWGKSSASVIMNNTIVGNGGPAISIQSTGSTATVTNNILAYNQTGLYRDPNTTVTNTYNAYFSNSTDFVNTQAGTGEVFSNPGFKNYETGNYNLLTTSPCIDIGNPDLDNDGKTWVDDPYDRDPDNTRSDMGALHLDQRSLTPNIPTGLTVKSCNNLITLKWKKNTGLYFDHYSIFGGNSTVTSNEMAVINNISDTVKVLTDLTHGQTYFFTIKAVNRSGVKSDFSNQVNAMVQTGVVPRIKTKWNDLLICYNLGDSISQYQWFRDGNPVEGETRQYYLSKSAGTYYVTSTDLNGCKNSSNSITLSGKTMSVYPNPAKSSFILRLDEEAEGEATVTVSNSSGIRLMQFKGVISDNRYIKDIPVDNLDNGIYYISVLIRDNKSYTGKIVVLK